MHNRAGQPRKTGEGMRLIKVGNDGNGAGISQFIAARRLAGYCEDPETVPHQR